MVNPSGRFKLALRDKEKWNADQTDPPVGGTRKTTD
jgi:hypothetical protein